MVIDDPKTLLFLCALQNAVKHGGVPQAGAVIGMVMGAHPELRSRAKEVSGLAKEAIADVAALSPEARISTLQERAPDMFAALS
jgi:glutamyl-tRNA synthetase